MSEVIISPSFIGYDAVGMKNNYENIAAIVEETHRIHVDVMREPFTDRRQAFGDKVIIDFYNRFSDVADFEFHLMSNTPLQVFKHIDPAVPADKRDRTSIIIPRESCRNYAPISEGGAGVYAGKENDLAALQIGSPDRQDIFRRLDSAYLEAVAHALQIIRNNGYQVGVSFEPGTQVELREELPELDIVLLMGVSSGTLDGKYDPAIADKIRRVRGSYNGIIQVEGGINEKVLPEVIEAGADKLVIEAPKSEDPVAPFTAARGIVKFLENCHH